MTARRLRWDELSDTHRAVYRDQWAAEREVADWFSMPSFTWEEERAAILSGRPLGWMPEGWVGMEGRRGSGRRKSVGDAFGAKVTDCSACSDSVEEWPGNNLQNLSATDWEPDGDGGCVRTLTQRDYTGTCVAGTSGGAPDGGECNSSDSRSPCAGSNASTTKAYVYEDGECYTTATCNCDGKEIRGGGQNCPPSQVTYTVRTVEDHSCSGTKRDAAWGGKEGPELAPPDDDCCHSMPSLDGTQPSPAPVPGDLLTVRVLNQYATGRVYANCVENSVIEDTLRHAYGLFLANPDIIAEAACAQLKSMSLTNCACKQFGAGARPVTLFSYPTGQCTTSQSFPSDQFIGKDYVGYVGLGNATDADSWTEGGDLYTEFFCGWLPNGVKSVLYAAAEQGASTTAAMLKLVALLAHELVHSSCSYRHSGRPRSLDAYADAVEAALKTRYGL